MKLFGYFISQRIGSTKNTNAILKQNYYEVLFLNSLTKIWKEQTFVSKQSSTPFFQTAAFSSHAMIAFLTYVVLLMTKVMLSKSLEKKADKTVLKGCI